MVKIPAAITTSGKNDANGAVAATCVEVPPKFNGLGATKGETLPANIAAIPKLAANPAINVSARRKNVPSL